MSCPVPEETLIGCSKDPKQLKTAPPLTTDNDCPTPEELPLPTQDGTPPTAPPTSTPLPLPVTRPTREVSLKESIGLVAAYQSLKERPEEYLPPGGMIDKKILDKYFFGYSVSVLCVPNHTADSLSVCVQVRKLGDSANVMDHTTPTHLRTVCPHPHIHTYAHAHSSVL